MTLSLAWFTHHLSIHAFCLTPFSFIFIHSLLYARTFKPARGGSCETLLLSFSTDYSKRGSQSAMFEMRWRHCLYWPGFWTHSNPLGPLIFASTRVWSWNDWQELLNFYYSVVTEQIQDKNYTRDVMQQHFDLCVLDFMRALHWRRSDKREVVCVKLLTDWWLGPKMKRKWICLCLVQLGIFQWIHSWTCLQCPRMATWIQRRTSLLGHAPLHAGLVTTCKSDRCDLLGLRKGGKNMVLLWARSSLYSQPQNKRKS